MLIKNIALAFVFLSPGIATTVAMSPALAQGIPADRKLDDRPAGSVVPEMGMAEQIKACLDPGLPGVRALVTVEGMDDAEGNVRVQVYGDNPEDFLENGKKLVRFDVPAEEDDMQVCVTFPGAGTYALVVMHDRNANGRADILTEGFGFSRNPRLLFSQPDHDEVAFEVGEGVTEMSVSLTYMFKLTNKGRKKRRRH